MPKRKHEGGVKCPKCGSFATKVSWTETPDGYFLRKRKCLQATCDGVVTTVERPVGETPESMADSIGKVLQGSFEQMVQNTFKRSGVKH